MYNFTVGTITDMSAQQQDSMMIDNTSSNQFSSHGITFRDPETGVLYVQMQLLQVYINIFFCSGFTSHQHCKGYMATFQYVGQPTV